MNAVGHGTFGEAVALATSSPFGVGGARFHYSEREEWVDTVYLGAWRREVFDRIGFFDEELVRDQDDEFNYRLRGPRGPRAADPGRQVGVHRARAGRRGSGGSTSSTGCGRCACSRSIRGRCSPASSLLQRSRRASSPRRRGPFAARARWGLAGLAAAYGWRNLAAALSASRRRPGAPPLVSFAFGILHLSYGFGFLTGLLPLRRPLARPACGSGDAPLSRRRPPRRAAWSASREHLRDIPFFRPASTDAEIDEVVDTLRSGWLTTGPKVKRFEEEFGARRRRAARGGAQLGHGRAAPRGRGTRAPGRRRRPRSDDDIRGDRGGRALPRRASDPRRLRPGHAQPRPRRRARRSSARCARAGLPARIPADARVVGIIPVHVGGLMLDVRRGRGARGGARPMGRRGCGPRVSRVVAPRRRERPGSAAARGPRRSAASPSTPTRRSRRAREAWRRRPTTRSRSACGSCRSTASRRTPGAATPEARKWDYRIQAPGFKYNLTDVAAAIGIHQLARAEEMRVRARAHRRAARRRSSPTSRRSSCRRRRPTGSTRGTSSRSACGSTGSPSTGTPSSTR